VGRGKKISSLSSGIAIRSLQACFVQSDVRIDEQNQIITVLDHYLEALLKKPRAIRDAHAFHSSDIPVVFRRFHQKMREQEGVLGDHKFIRLLLLHRDIGMEKLAQAFTEAEKTQVYRYETVHEIIQKLMGNCQETSGLSKEDTPVCLWQTKKALLYLLGY